MKRLLLPAVLVSALFASCGSTDTMAEGQAMTPEATSCEGGSCCSEGAAAEKASCCSEGAGSGAAEVNAHAGKGGSCCEGDGPKTGCADCVPATAAPVEAKGTN